MFIHALSFNKYSRGWLGSVLYIFAAFLFLRNLFSATFNLFGYAFAAFLIRSSPIKKLRRSGCLLSVWAEGFGCSSFSRLIFFAFAAFLIYAGYRLLKGKRVYEHKEKKINLEKEEQPIFFSLCSYTRFPFRSL
jgi:lia operon protein LiaF